MAATPKFEDQSIEDLFSFDPFENSEPEAGEENPPASDDSETHVADGTGKDETGDASAAGENDETQVSDSSSQTAEPNKSREPAPKEPDETTELKNTVAHLNEQLQQLRQQQEQAQRAQEKPKEEDENENSQIPDYGTLAIPRSITDAITSGEPEQVEKGLQELIRGIGASVHGTLRAEMESKLSKTSEKVKSEVTNSVQQQSTTQTVKNDYFSKYSHHDAEIVRPVLSRVAAQVVRESGANGWTPDLWDKIGQRVEQELKPFGLDLESQNAKKQQQAPAKPAAQNAANGSRPPAQHRSGTVPSGAAKDSVADDISKTLFG